MRSVRGELRERFHSGFEPAQHGVQNFRQPGQFVSSGWNGKPLRKIFDADRQCRRGNVMDRLQRAPAQPRAAHACDRNHDGNQAQQEKPQKLQSMADLPDGSADVEIEALRL